MIDVYVFGAGASAGATFGAPLMKEFLQQGFEVFCLSDQKHILEQSYYQVARFIDKLYGSNVEDTVQHYAQIGTMAFYNVPPSATIEELLTYVELEATNESWMDVQTVKQALSEFVYETIQHFIMPHYGGHFTPTPSGEWIKTDQNCYDKFIATKVDHSRCNCFISFNYDLLLDHACWRAHPILPANYNLPFVQVDLWPQYKTLLEGRMGQIHNDLLKLHGSMNWARCDKCGCLQLVYFRLYRELFKMGCTRCGSLLSPVLIPPSLRKDIKNYGLTNLWDKAEDALAMTDNITVIGYSFPDADLEAKWLFKKAVAKGGRKPHLTIIDPSVNIRQRIKDFFGGTVGGVKEMDTFKTYVTELAS